jgi:neuroplastin
MTDADIDIEYDEFKDHVSFVDVDDVKNARLVIDKVKLSDRGYYTCIGRNTAMGVEVKSEGFLRIKDKLAALWPFLGIVAEVFVLCAIIFIYENRRNKTDLDESDTDQSPDQ